MSQSQARCPASLSTGAVGSLKRAATHQVLIVASSTVMLASNVATRLISVRSSALSSHRQLRLVLPGFWRGYSLLGGRSFPEWRGGRRVRPQDGLEGDPKGSRLLCGQVAATGANAVTNGHLSFNLQGKKAFIAGVADDQGFGWAIAKALCEAGAEVFLGVWVPTVKIFETSLKRGKFDASRKLNNGHMMEITKVYPLDAMYDTPEAVPEEVATNKRYAMAEGYTISEVAAKVKNDFGSIDILIHSLANAPEVTKDLLDTSRQGYLAALSASSYSFVSMVNHFAPVMKPGGAALSLSYIAAAAVIPGYGGGMSSAKAALESDTRVLAYEAGRKYGVRVNTVSAGPLGSRAAKAIGFIEEMIAYSYANGPLKDKELLAPEVANVAAFLVSPLASAITGQVIYADNGLSIMGVALDSKTFADVVEEHT